MKTFVFVVIYAVLFVANPLTGLAIPLFSLLRPLSLMTALNIAAGLFMLVLLCAIVYKGDWPIPPAVYLVLLATPWLQSLAFYGVRVSFRRVNQSDGSIDVEDI